MSLRILLRVSPRQSPSSAILFEMRFDADWPWLVSDFFMFSSLEVADILQPFPATLWALQLPHKPTASIPEQRTPIESEAGDPVTEGLDGSRRRKTDRGAKLLDGAAGLGRESGEIGLSLGPNLDRVELGCRGGGHGYLKRGRI
jgi:hypothetical protein